MHKYFFALSFCCFNCLFAQTDSYSIQYDGYIDFTNNSCDKISNLTEKIIWTKDKSVCWHNTNENYNNISNDSTIFLQVDSGARYLLTYKDFTNGRTTFEFTSGLLRTKPNIFFDTIYPMRWIITNIRKNINDKECVKALTIFRGRAYAAWFNPKIPIFDGPWKFCGLPGLIVEIYDENKTVYWKMTAIRATAEKVGLIPNTKMNYNDFKREFNEGFDKFVKASSASDTQDPTCIECAQSLKYNIQTIENILEQ